MGQHFTRNTVEASAWCQTCSKMTPHRVSDRRLRHCLSCAERKQQEGARAKTAAAKDALADFHAKAAKQGRLF
jgi:ribosomal protein L44E